LLLINLNEKNKRIYEKRIGEKMKIEYCPNKRCPHCEIDIKAEKEKRLFNIAGLKTIDCFAPNGKCVFYEKKQSNVLAEKSFEQVAPAQERKCLLITYGEKILFRADEGTDLFNMIMKTPDRSMCQFTEFALQRNGDWLNIYTKGGHFLFENQSYTEYRRTFGIPFCAKTPSEWKAWRLHK
jgi:hypothetical protein